MYHHGRFHFFQIWDGWRGALGECSYSNKIHINIYIYIGVCVRVRVWLSEQTERKKKDQVGDKG